MPAIDEIGKRKIFIGLIAGLSIIFCLEGIGLLAYRYQNQKNLVTSADKFKVPAQKETSISSDLPTDTSKSLISDRGKEYHILILGIDRRGPYDEGFRSDINLLASFSKSRKKVVLTSIPRDLWIDGSRVNAFITQEGIDATREKVEQIVGVRPDRFVRIDFDAYVDAVDAVGGIDINVPNTFTDSTYPDDRNGQPGVTTIHFDAGQQHLNGEQALYFARSRKGDGGEGNDFRRMVRQQIVLASLPKAFLSPKCIFNPFVLTAFYQAVNDRLKTDFTIDDTKLAYDLLKSSTDVVVDNLVLDHTYLYAPDPDLFGGAMILRPQNESFTAIHEALAAKLQE